MEVDLLTQVLYLYKEKNWKKIIKLGNLEYARARKLAWVWPSENNLELIKNVIEKFNLNGVISIGCGCGLFEWLLQQYSGLPVIGYEVNKEWWMSKYCNPQFIELNFPNVLSRKKIKPSLVPPTQDILNPNYALMFCYFNNGEAFKEYISCYNGNLVFIIGPGKGAGRHTNPEPFKPDFGCLGWTLYKSEEVRDTKDFIAVYIREKNV